VAFETRPVKSVRPAVSAQPAVVHPAPMPQPASIPQPQPVAGGKINREEIAAIVDRFLAGRRSEETPTPLPVAPEVEAGSMYTGTAKSPAAVTSNGGSAASSTQAQTTASTANGHKPVDFVSEDDVRRAIQKGEKIYINGRTIITPAARDIGEPAEVFAKV